MHQDGNLREGALKLQLLEIDLNAVPIKHMARRTLTNTMAKAMNACKSTTPNNVPNVPTATTATLRMATTNSHHSLPGWYPMYNNPYRV